MKKIFLFILVIPTLACASQTSVEKIDDKTFKIITTTTNEEIVSAADLKRRAANIDTDINNTTKVLQERLDRLQQDKQNIEKVIKDSEADATELTL